MYQILLDRSILEIKGLDAINFLNRLITNDIIAHEYCYSYSLSSTGRYLFDFFIFKRSNVSLLVDIHVSQVKCFIEYILKYKLRSKIELIDLSDLYYVIYSKKQLMDRVMFSFKDPRYYKLGFRSIIDKIYVDNVLMKEKIINDLYLKDKYYYTIIDGYIDLLFNKSIPMEYGAEVLNSINYTKGCYIGQEVVSRIKYQSVIRKKIFKLYSNTNINNVFVSKDIVINDTIIGMLCSSYQNLGIVLIKLNIIDLLQNFCFTVNNINFFLRYPVWS